MDVSGDELSDFSQEEVKEKEFEYEVLSAEEVMSKPLQMIEEVNEVLQVHPMLARQVLQYFNWNKENAVQRYFAEQDKIFRVAKLPRPDDLKTFSLAALPAKVECTICFDSCSKKDVDALPCGHLFCKACWRDYLGQKVLREGTSHIECPAIGCTLSMDEFSVLKLIDNEDGKKLYTKLAAKAFVREMKGIRWCPGKECEYAIKAELTLPKARPSFFFSALFSRGVSFRRSSASVGPSSASCVLCRSIARRRAMRCDAGSRKSRPKASRWRSLRRTRRTVPSARLSSTRTRAAR